MNDIRILDASTAEREQGRLAEILADCVNGGASVSFMWPFSVADAKDWWRGAIGAVGSGHTILFGGYVEGVLMGTVQLSFDVPPNQRHRGDVRKLLVRSAGRNRRNRRLPDERSRDNRPGTESLASDPRYRDRHTRRASLRPPGLYEGRRHSGLRPQPGWIDLRRDVFLEGAVLIDTERIGGEVSPSLPA